ncbi:MAG: sterol desaturase family protein [Planctomycetes bacterium]|nr:sterol desaturase family protein [Planctomycetota bacterium]
MALAEFAWPRRRLTTDKPRRWLSNLGLAAINSLVLRVLAPAGIAGVALLAESQGWGLLNRLDMPFWLSVLICVVLLDLVVYLQHVLFHALPFLWRLHRVHHADLDMDVTTGARFHTLEMVISHAIKLAAVLLLGAPALAVLIFEMMLNATSLFNHANVKLPGWLDAFVRLVIVTPDMHRVHHSTNPEETNRNFGFSLPWWDFLLGTYLAQPAKGHAEMAIGLPEVRDERVAEGLAWMLALPFQKGNKADVSGGSKA